VKEIVSKLVGLGVAGERNLKKRYSRKKIDVRQIKAQRFEKKLEL
jgi:hypothetical protein